MLYIVKTVKNTLKLLINFSQIQIVYAQFQHFCSLFNHLSIQTCNKLLRIAESLLHVWVLFGYSSILEWGRNHSKWLKLAINYCSLWKVCCMFDPLLLNLSSIPPIQEHQNPLKMAINYLESSKVYCMFEHVFSLFNRL